MGDKAPSPADVDERKQYFVVDASNATFLEIWRVLGPRRGRLSQLIAILFAKFSGKPLRFGIPISRDETEFIALNEIPDEIKRQQEPLGGPLIHAGFVPLFGIKNERPESLKGYCVVLRSSDRMTVASVLFVQAKNAVRMILQLSSKRNDNTIIATNNSAPLLRLPPELKALNLKNASPNTVLSRHKRCIQEFTDLAIFSDDDARSLVRDMSRQICDYRVNSGLYVPATEEELRRAGLTTTN